MGWLHRIGGARPRDPEPEIPSGPVPVERRTPGVAELFAELPPGPSYSVLDLGPASESHLRIYGGFARHVRFADLLTGRPKGDAWTEALRSLPPHPPRGYDLVLTWNLLDRLGPEERTLVMATLVRHTAPGSRLYAVVDASGGATVQALRFTLSSLDRVVQEVVGPPEPAREPLLPAPMERLLTPFEVVRAYTLRMQLREYVAIRPADHGWATGPRH